jgi:hypothetical protein
MTDALCVDLYAFYAHYSIIRQIYIGAKTVSKKMLYRITSPYFISAGLIVFEVVGQRAVNVPELIRIGYISELVFSGINTRSLILIVNKNKISSRLNLYVCTYMNMRLI